METHPTEEIFQFLQWGLTDLEGMRLPRWLQIQTEETANSGICRLQGAVTG